MIVSSRLNREAQGLVERILSAAEAELFLDILAAGPQLSQPAVEALQGPSYLQPAGRSAGVGATRRHNRNGPATQAQFLDEEP